MGNPSSPSKTVSAPKEATRFQAAASPRWYSYLTVVVLVALPSTIAGFFSRPIEGAIANCLNMHPVAANSGHAALVATPHTLTISDMEEISRLAPQQQAERLLELAIGQPDLSLGLIHRNLASWRGQLNDSDRLFHLVLEALNSDDPRVRVAAVEIDLLANNLAKSPESVEKLERQIQHGTEARYMALWRLGALGNRGVEPSQVFSTLKLYARSRNQQVRFWAVEGLAMLGSGQSIDALLDVLAHDPAEQIRQRAANALSKSGLLTGEQRLTAVPQLLNLLDDDSVDAATEDLVGATLEAITGASFGKNAAAWRDWWAHHDTHEKHPSHHRPGMLVA